MRSVAPTISGLLSSNTLFPLASIPSPPPLLYLPSLASRNFEDNSNSDAIFFKYSSNRLLVNGVGNAKQKSTPRYRRSTERNAINSGLENFHFDESESGMVKCSRRSAATKVLLLSSSLPLFGIGESLWNYALASESSPSNLVDMPALRGKDYGKSRMRYPDYIETSSGLQYKDLKEGDGESPVIGDGVVVDWDGFTIGYYGRIFEARNKAKGGSFEGNEKIFFRFTVGSSQVIPAFNEVIQGMRVGGIRRFIVPPEIGYPDNDFGKAGPRPLTFSGQRALDFVLKNQGLIDKTLLFDIELLKVIHK